MPNDPDWHPTENLPQPHSEVGDVVAHYKILSLLGTGGMGKVYLAEDTKLLRKVSLKFISGEYASDEEALRRFEQEARATSALNHTNIITIYDIGAWADRRFIAAEYIEGQTLRQRLGSNINIDEVLDISIQIASALVAAHRLNIVHRDLKPENIMIREEDHLVKVLDFGLAKITHTSPQSQAITARLNRTEPGVVMGTLAYMSPEQARGDAIDERTDIWSLGIVIFEMIAGCSPVAAQSSNEIISAILSRQPVPPLKKYCESAPDGLEQIVQKALAKDRDQRYQTSKELLADLKQFQSQLTQPTQTRASTESVANRPTAAIEVKTSTRLASAGKTAKVAVILSLLLVLTLGVFGYRYLHRPTTQIKSLAVLPLNNLSNDPNQEYFADGITESLITNLSQISALRVISRVSAMHYKGSSKSLPEIAKELNVDAVVEGSIQRAGNKVHITVRLIPAATDSASWTEEYDRDLSDVLKLQNEIARNVSQQIRIQVTAGERAKLSASRSIDPAAHEAYLLGRYHVSKLNEDDLRQAIDYFERAIQIAPDYAEAYGGLGEAWSERGVWGAMQFKEVEAPARAAALKALELDEQCVEGHVVLANLKFSHDWDWTGAEQEAKRALQLDSGEANPHRLYAILLMALGRHDEAIRQMQAAEQIDPVSAELQSTYGRILYRAGKNEEAVKHYQRAIELDSRSYSAKVRLADVYAMMGRFEEAIALEQQASELRSDGSLKLRLARVYAMMGRRGDALQLIQEATKDSQSVAALAAAYAALHDNDAAFRILEKEVDEHTALTVFIKEDPGFVNLRSDPRWNPLLRRMNFPGI